MRSDSRWALAALTSTLALLLTACPQSQSVDGAKGASGEGAGQGTPPEMSSAAHPDDARWKIAAGEGVAINGSVAYPGEAPEGAVRIDVLTQAGEAPPHLVSAETLDALGPFTIRAPKDFGEVHLVAFIDRSGDGPSPDDAAAATTVTIGAEDIADVVLTLSDEPDLGGLTPGAPPTENGGEKTEGAPPTGPDGEAPPEGAGGPPNTAGAGPDEAQKDPADPPAE